jgi:hypothetical protein
MTSVCFTYRISFELLTGIYILQAWKDDRLFYTEPFDFMCLAEESLARLSKDDELAKKFGDELRAAGTRIFRTYDTPDVDELAKLYGIDECDSTSVVGGIQTRRMVRCGEANILAPITFKESTGEYGVSIIYGLLNSSRDVIHPVLNKHVKLSNNYDNALREAYAWLACTLHAIHDMDAEQREQFAHLVCQYHIVNPPMIRKENHGEEGEAEEEEDAEEGDDFSDAGA